MTEAELMLAIEKLVDAARKRVLDWAAAKYEKGLHDVKSPLGPTVGPPTWKDFSVEPPQKTVGDPPVPFPGVTYIPAQKFTGCMWDNVPPGQPMWMVCSCPRCANRITFATTASETATVTRNDPVFTVTAWNTAGCAPLPQTFTSTTVFPQHVVCSGPCCIPDLFAPGGPKGPRIDS